MKKKYEKIQDKRVVSAADLLLECARKVWIIVLCIIVFAILATGYKYYKDKQYAELEQTTVEEKEISEKELLQIEEYEKNANLAQRMRTYGTEAPLMQINPMETPTATLQYVINLPEAEQDTNLLSVEDKEKIYSDIRLAYKNYIENGGILSNVQESEDLPIKYMGELITYQNADKDATEQITSFNVQVIAPDEDECKELSAQVAAGIAAYNENLNANGFGHTLVLMNDSYAVLVNQDLLVKQANYFDRLNNQEDKNETLKGKLSSEQQLYIDKFMVQGEKEDAVEEVSENATPIYLSKKYMCVGAAAGFVIAILVILVNYLVRATVNSANDIRYLYNERVLAEIYISKQNPLYKRLYKKFYRQNVNVPMQEKIHTLAANIVSACQKDQVTEVLLACDWDEKDVAQWLPGVEAELEKHKIHIIVLKGSLEEAESIEAMMHVKNVILVEKVSGSRYERLTRELEICVEQDVCVQGIVLLH